MALTELQERVCRLLAERRIESGEAYVAGDTALNEILGSSRLSSDADRFHDTAEAVLESASSDRALLAGRGISVEPIRELRGFVEIIARDGDGSSVVIQWVQESSFRFFPLVTHPVLGLTLHPVDLATNKVLALVGRVEVRDWVDILTCHQRLSPLGCLAWAACGKDAGLGPGFILEQAARTARYSALDVATLDFEGEAPDPHELSRIWRAALDEARVMIEMLPPDELGRVVLEAGDPFRGDASALERALVQGRLSFHAGSVRGALPTVRAATD
jgi:hypothetical protein